MSSRRLVTAASLSLLSLLAGCGSAGRTDLRSSKPVIHVTSARGASDVSECLQSRLSSVTTTRVEGNTELLVGSDEWLITLTPYGYGTIVKVQQAGGNEPEVRFAIARCTT
jgi:hypothetical protein